MVLEVEMSEKLTIDSLRAAIQQIDTTDTGADDERFLQMAKRYEVAVEHLVTQIQRVVDQVPELEARLEDEVETFTAPGYPDKTLDIKSRRIRISHRDDSLLFDPTAKALLSALGQIEIEASRPIPFMVEKILYLIPDSSGASARWGYRSIDNLGGPLTPFTQQDLLRLLKVVFAGD
jgi:hypothetical protein